jgi:acetyl-CoA C-acetyltransferase
MNANNIPVIIGVGEVTEKIRDPLQGNEPIALMEQALRAAELDAGASLLATIDSLDIVAEYSWPYADPIGLLNGRIGAKPAHAEYGVAGGESPVRFIHEAALRIARGECKVAAVVGAEAAYTRAAAKKANVMLPWTPRDHNAKLLRGRDMVNPICVRHGVDQPIHVYPFYENAAQAQWGQTPREALQESGKLWSEFAAVAASNPHAWLKKTFSAEEITTPSEKNRLICWPYTKHMVANPAVNQGAAILLTSQAHARELGILDQCMIHILGGAAANEPRDYLARDQYHHSHAQDAVLTTVAAMNGGAFDFIELYSCFPCVPKMAQRSLNLSADTKLTVTGGLSFFGAPLNNYMSHAAASLVGALRGKNNAKALLYGQGEYVTKHHAIILASGSNVGAQLEESYRVQAASDAARGPVPELLENYVGPASVETFTIVYGREGAPQFGTVIARTPTNGRLMARVLATDTSTIAMLTDLDSSPIGANGVVKSGDDELLIWSKA